MLLTTEKDKSNYCIFFPTTSLDFNIYIKKSSTHACACTPMSFKCDWFNNSINESMNFYSFVRDYTPYVVFYVQKLFTAVTSSIFKRFVDLF